MGVGSRLNDSGQDSVCGTWDGGMSRTGVPPWHSDLHICSVALGLQHACRPGSCICHSGSHVALSAPGLLLLRPHLLPICTPSRVFPFRFSEERL